MQSVAAMNPSILRIALFYRLVWLVMAPVAHIYFRRIEVLHRGRLPRRGPLLVIANHPSSLSDVIVIAVALPRRMRFVAYSGLFHPWIHAQYLRALGTIPVYRREDAAGEMHRNAETFAALRRAFEQGEVVTMFPEGTSRAERNVERLKTGAARAALAFDADPAHHGRLVLLPVGITFSALQKVRSDVTIVVGEPVDLATWSALHRESPDSAVHGLTEELRERLTELILHVPERRLEGFVDRLIAVSLDAYAAANPGVPRFELARRLGDVVDQLRREDPDRLARLERRVATYFAALDALGLPDDVMREAAGGVAPRRHRARLLALGAAGALPALAGTLPNLPAILLTDLAGRLFGKDPTRFSFARIMGGIGAVSLTYGTYAVWLLAQLDLPRLDTIGVLVGIALLGVFAFGYGRWLVRERHRLRLAVLIAAKPALMGKLRRRRATIVRACMAATSPDRRKSA
jgi:1-acyl-sn-glycerol-3-phosphate acyltransferase